jgi:hypothetical protein
VTEQVPSRSPLRPWLLEPCLAATRTSPRHLEGPSCRKEPSEVYPRRACRRLRKVVKCCKGPSVALRETNNLSAQGGASSVKYRKGRPRSLVMLCSLSGLDQPWSTTRCPSSDSNSINGHCTSSTDFAALIARPFPGFWPSRPNSKEGVYPYLRAGYFLLNDHRCRGATTARNYLK